MHAGEPGRVRGLHLAVEDITEARAELVRREVEISEIRDFGGGVKGAPLDASSGKQNRHRLSRTGNRRMNHMIHIAAVTQIRLDTEGRAYYRRKRAEGKKPMEAMRCLKRRTSDSIYRQLIADQQRPGAAKRGTVREGTAGRLKNPARSTYPRTSTLLISHFPDPQQRRYARHRRLGRPTLTEALRRVSRSDDRRRAYAWAHLQPWGIRPESMNPRSSRFASSVSTASPCG